MCLCDESTMVKYSSRPTGSRDNKIERYQVGILIKSLKFYGSKAASTWFADMEPTSIQIQKVHTVIYFTQVFFPKKKKSKYLKKCHTKKHIIECGCFDNGFKEQSLMYLSETGELHLKGDLNYLWSCNQHRANS